LTEESDFMLFDYDQAYKNASLLLFLKKFFFRGLFFVIDTSTSIGAMPSWENELERLTVVY